MGLFDRFKKNDQKVEENKSAIITDEEDALYKIETTSPYAVIPRLSDELKKNKNIALACVSRDGMLINAFSHFNEDPEICFAATRDNFNNIQYTSPAFRSNPKCVAIALADYTNQFIKKLEPKTETEYKDDVIKFSQQLFRDNITSDKKIMLGIPSFITAEKIQSIYWDKIKANTQSTLNEIRANKLNEQNLKDAIQDM